MDIDSISQSYHRRAGLEHALRAHDLPCGPTDVRRAHVFDCELHSALSAALAAIELALRGRVDVVARGFHGPSWFEEPDAFRDGTDLGPLRTRVRRELDRAIPPGRAAAASEFGRIAEELSLGTLSQVCGLLRPPVQRVLAQSFDLPAPTLRSTLQHLSHVRNLCAHHVRLLGRTMQNPPPRYRHPEALAAAMRAAEERRAFASVALTAHVSAGVPDTDRVRHRLHDVLEEHGTLLPTIGCPAAWRTCLRP